MQTHTHIYIYIYMCVCVFQYYKGILLSTVKCVQIFSRFCCPNVLLDRHPLFSSMNFDIFTRHHSQFLCHLTSFFLLPRWHHYLLLFFMTPSPLLSQLALFSTNIFRVKCKKKVSFLFLLSFTSILSMMRKVCICFSINDNSKHSVTKRVWIGSRPCIAGSKFLSVVW